MNERGLGTRSSQFKLGWEASEDFPIVCETCLGQNPFLRMTRKEWDAECKICARPFTVFRWQPSGRGRFKKTQICQTCAKMKNVCQTCLLDLQYGLPVEVRDKLMGLSVNIPKLEANRDFWAQQMSAHLDKQDLPYDNQKHPALEQAQGKDETHFKKENTSYAVIRNQEGVMLDFKEQKEVKENKNAKQFQKIKAERGSGKLPQDQGKKILQNLDRNQKPQYNRNLPHICSFFIRGKCNRGQLCPYRHQVPENIFDKELANQNLKNRYYGVDDPVAKRILDNVSETILPQEPKNESITTIYIGGINDKVSEYDLKKQFKSFGRIVGIKTIIKNNCAFVKLENRAACRAAIQELHRGFEINGVKLKVFWAQENLKSKEEERKITKKDYSRQDRDIEISKEEEQVTKTLTLISGGEKKIKKPPVVAYEDSSEQEEEGQKK